MKSIFITFLALIIYAGAAAQKKGGKVPIVKTPVKPAAEVRPLLGKKDSLPVTVRFEEGLLVISVDTGRKDTTIEIAVICLNNKKRRLDYSALQVTNSNKSIEVLPEKTKVFSGIGGDTDRVVYKVRIRLDSTSARDTLIPLMVSLTPKGDSAADVINPNSFILVKRRITEKHAPARYRPSATFVTYTDFQGFKGDRPNGLVQVETNFNFYLRHKKPSDPDRTNVMFGRNVLVGINLTKLEDKLRYKPLNYFIDTTGTVNDTIRHIHTFDLVQYSNFNIYAKLNLLYVKWPATRWRLFFDLFGAIYSTGVSDSLLAEPNFNINSIGVGYSLKIATNFEQDYFPINVAFSVKGFKINSYSNTVRQRVGPLYYPETDTRNNQYFANGIVGGKSMTIFQMELTYSPSADRDRSGRIFFRTSYYNNIFGRVLNNETNPEYGNNFLQVQMGYAGPFSDILGRFFPTKAGAAQSSGEVPSGK